MTPPNVRALSWGAQLTWAEQTLASAGSPSPQRDALVLLMHLVHVPPALLLAQPERTLVPSEVTRYAAWVNRRAQGEPVPYITGHQVFMGLDLQVDRRTSLARPSTACLIEAALECLRSRPPEERELLVADVGTGCGAIALALGLFEPRIAHIYALDSSADALEVARGNGERYLLNLFVSWLTGDTLEPIPEPVDLIVANRPYRHSATDWASPAVPPAIRPGMLRYKSYPAHGSADDEMAHLARLMAQAPAKLRPGGTLIFALDVVQRAAVAALLAETLAEAHVWSYSPQDGQDGGDGLVIAQLPH